MAHDLTPGFCELFDTPLSTVWGLTYINVRRGFSISAYSPACVEGQKFEDTGGAAC
jgi:hypothetical protein